MAVAATKRGQTAPKPGITARDVTSPGAAGNLPARIYTPAGTSQNRPLIVYFHGGGWVIADIDTYDVGAHAIARASGAVVVSCEYRRAPENKFPAAHDDVVACYKWATANAASWGAGGKAAIAGESAGGNLAIDTGIAARDQKLKAASALLPIPCVQTGKCWRLRSAAPRSARFARSIRRPCTSSSAWMQWWPMQKPPRFSLAAS